MFQDTSFEKWCVLIFLFHVCFQSFKVNPIHFYEPNKVTKQMKFDYAMACVCDFWSCGISLEFL